jgi:hypothetical protein
MRKSLADVKKWETGEIKKASRNWRGMCQAHARSAWGLAAWAPSAKLALAAIPHKNRHETDYRQVPAGAIIYDPNLSRYGHAWVSAGGGKAWSTDYVRPGKIDLVDAHLPRWRKGNTKVVWVDAVPINGHIVPLPLGK